MAWHYDGTVTVSFASRTVLYVLGMVLADSVRVAWRELRRGGSDEAGVEIQCDQAPSAMTVCHMSVRVSMY